MTPKQWYKRAAAMLTAFALMFVLIPFAGRANVEAAGEKAVSLAGAKLLVNGHEVTNETTLNNGDEIFFTFDWSVNKGEDETLVNPLVADIDFQGVYLLATEGPLQQNSVNRGTYKIIRTAEGNKIQFYVEEDQLKESRINGTAVFKGNISYTSDDVGDDGRFEIKATVQGSPVMPTLRPLGHKTEEQDRKGAWSNKQTSGTVYKGSDGSYYQDYTVTVGANWDNTEDYIINTVDDQPADPSKTSFTGTITASSTGTVTGLKSSYNSFSDIKGIKLGKGAEVKFKYTMKVDSQIVTDQNSLWEYRNIVQVNDLYPTQASPWGLSEALRPDVTKTSTVNEATHQIKWNVTISYINFTGNKETDKKLVSNIKDTIEEDPTTKEKPTVIGNELNDEEFWSRVEPKQITITDKNNDKLKYTGYSYTYTYTAEYDDNNVAVDRHFRNVFSATVDKYNVSDDDTVTIAGSGTVVDKQFTGVNGDGTLSWKIILQTPATGSAKDIVFTDSAFADEGLSHKIVPGSIIVKDQTGQVIGHTLTNNDTIKINSTVAGGKTLTVTLNTEVTDDGLRSGTYYNRVTASYTHVLAGGKEVKIPPSSDQDQYTTTNAVTKSAFDDYSRFNTTVNSSKSRVGWFVNVNFDRLKGTALKAGDKIVIKDTAQLIEVGDWQTPDKAVASNIDIEQIYAVTTSGNMWYASNEDTLTSQYLNSNVKLTDPHTIEITVTQKMLDSKNISIYYTQTIPNTELLSGRYRVDNSAKVTYNGRGIGIEDARSREIAFSKEDVLKKSNSTEGAIIHYTVEVNRPELSLSGDEDDIVVLEDVMGNLLRLKEDTITVVDGSGTPLASNRWSYTFDSSSRKLRITLPDRTFCLVKYDAFADIKTEYVRNDEGQITSTVYKVNGNVVSLDEIKNGGGVTNTASLAGSGGFSESTSDVWAAAGVSGEVTVNSTVGSLVVNKYDSLNKSLRLNGAEFSLVSGRFIGGEFTPYTNEHAHKTLETVSYNTGNSSDTLFDNLEYDIVYELKEVTAPDNYKVFEGERYIVIRAPGDPDPVIENIPAGITVECFVAGETINIPNELGDDDDTTDTVTEVNISKREIGGSAELPGAKIRIARVAGNAADLSKDSITVSGGAQNVTKSESAIEFTSGSSPAVITGLPAGEYRMVEDAAPAGYKKATAITFKINILKDGSYTVTRGGAALANKTVVMEDEITEMSISKQNVFADEIPGARLTLTGTDASGKTINFSTLGGIKCDNATLTKGSRSLAFTSGTEPTVIYGLVDGKYVLHEESAPSGYILTQDIRFEIKSGTVMLIEDDGSSGGSPVGNKLIMTDDRTSVFVKKSDVTGVPQIPGATIQITPREDVDVSKVDVYNAENVTKSRGRVTFKTTTHQAEIRGLPAGQYIFSELYAPEGYTLVQSDFVLTINEDGTAVPRYNEDEYSYDDHDPNYEDYGYDYDCIFHKITMKDAIRKVTPDDIPPEDFTLGMSGLPITKMDMADGVSQLEGATLSIIPVGNGASVAGATAEYNDGGTKQRIDTNDGTALTFVTPGKIVYVYGLTVGNYRLIETSAPDNYEIKDEFNFEVVIVNNQYRVIAGEDNGYNILTDSGVKIRNYLTGKYPDPEKPETEPLKTSMATEPATSPDDENDESDGGNGNGGGDGSGGSGSNTETAAPTGTMPAPSYPTGPSGGYGPSGGVPVSTGRQGPGYFIDPSITNHIDRNHPTEPMESEDIKAGIYVVDTDSGSDAKDAAIGMAVVAVMASAVYAVSKALKRRRSR